jgi:NADP-dependent 3-hydroxy acid dehydrogenase YdfG
MASSVTGKVAFMTGGASGTGAAIENELVNAGAEVWYLKRLSPAMSMRIERRALNRIRDVQSAVPTQT